MDIGIGFSETLLVLILVLVFFGSRQMPQILREVGRITATIRKKTTEVLNEIQSAGDAVTENTDEAKEQKDNIREKVKTERRNQAVEERDRKSTEIVKRLIDSDVWKNAGAVMLYSALRDEVQTRDLIKLGQEQGKRMVLPSVEGDGHRMRIYEVKNTEEELEKGPFNIMQPRDDRKNRFYKSDLELILLPGVAFDRQGKRIGFGRGYYDKFLSELEERDIKKVGLAFGFQVVEEIPFDYHDVPVDYIVTEDEVIEAGVLKG